MYLKLDKILEVVVFSIFASMIRLKLALFLFAAITSFILTAATPKDVFADTVIDHKIADLINAERNKSGLTSLNFSDKLTQAATKHNELMKNCSSQFGVDPCFTHQVNQLGEPSLMTRINQTGYSATAVGEIIAWNYSSPAGAVAGWMNSTGHRNIILSSTYKDIGCNYFSTFYTCDFGKSSITQPVSTPLPSVLPSVSPSKTPIPSPSATPRPSASVKPSSSPSIKPSASPSVTQIVIPTPPPLFSTKPWWCQYAPTHDFCR